MDVRKIINKILLEAEEQKSNEGYTDYIGRPLPSIFGGQEITNVSTIGEMPSSFDKLNSNQVYDNFCNKRIKDNTSKFYGMTFEDCLNLQKKMIYDIQNLGAPNGLRSFTWKGQTFKACLRRNKEKETLSFSGYYGTIDSKSNCFAPEWFYMIQEDKKKNDKGGTGTPGSSKEMTIAGPDFK